MRRTRHRNRPRSSRARFRTAFFAAADRFAADQPPASKPHGFPDRPNTKYRSHVRGSDRFRVRARWVAARVPADTRAPAPSLGVPANVVDLRAARARTPSSRPRLTAAATSSSLT
jgi:hypothetical protein